MIPFGGLMMAVGLIMALAVADRWSAVDLTAAGWIIALVGLVLLVAGIVTSTARRRTEHRIVEDRHIHQDHLH
jgi:hypothetical protein